MDFLFFFFWLVCLNDVWAVPMINKVVNTARSSFWTMCKTKNISQRIILWGLEFCLFGFVFFVCFVLFCFVFPLSLSLQRMETMRKKLFELQELQLCWHFCCRNTPRSILQEPSELANQISLDNLLQRSAALKSTQCLIIWWSRLHTG